MVYKWLINNHHISKGYGILLKWHGLKPPSVVLDQTSFRHLKLGDPPKKGTSLVNQHVPSLKYHLGVYTMFRQTHITLRLN